MHVTGSGRSSLRDEIDMDEVMRERGREEESATSNRRETPGGPSSQEVVLPETETGTTAVSSEKDGIRRRGGRIGTGAGSEKSSKDEDEMDTDP